MGYISYTLAWFYKGRYCLDEKVADVLEELKEW